VVKFGAPQSWRPAVRRGAPDLRESAIAFDRQTFAGLLKEGTLVSNGMPKFDDLSGDEVEDLYQFIRAKARLKGIETKAEASSAVAEARILMLRLKDEKGSAASVARVQEKLDRAEQQLQEGNFGAAIFFAMRAKELLDPARGHATPKKPQDPAKTPSER